MHNIDDHCETQINSHYQINTLMKKLLLILLLTIPILAMGQSNGNSGKVKVQPSLKLNSGKDKKTEANTKSNTKPHTNKNKNNNSNTGAKTSGRSNYADTYINVDGDNSTDVAFTEEGGSRELSINTNAGSWSVASSPAWVIIGNKTRQGMTLRVSSNTGTQPRSGQVVLKTPKGHKATINVTQATAAMTGKPSVTMKNVKQLHNQSLSDGQGMKILLTFDIQNFKGKDARAVAYFYDADENQLIDTDNVTGYGTKGNVSHVAAFKKFKPPYDNSTYTDLEISIPYAQLHQTGTNSRTLKFEIYIWDESTDDGDAFYMPGTFYSFSFTPGSNNTTNYYLMVDGKTDSPQSIRYEASGGYATYEVSTNASDYETWGVPSWCSITNKTSTGFRLVCQPNTLNTERSDYMKVKAGGQEIRINIKQDANSEGASATIDRVWLEENVTQNGQKGLKVHAHCEINQMKDQVADFQIWFYQSDNLTKVCDTSGSHLTYSEEHTVIYESSVWKDFQFFVPYSDFSSDTPNGTLTVDFVIRNSSGETLVRNDNHSFTFNSSYRGGGNSGSTSTSSTGKIHRVWMEHGVYQNGKKGMKVHAHCELSGQKGKKVDFQIWFYQEDDFTRVLNTQGNHLWYEEEQTVLYDNSEWKDFVFFVPYDDFSTDTPSGTLAVDFNIRDTDFNLLAGSENNQFTFTNSSSTQRTPTASNTSATINRVWMEYGVYQDGQKGMKVHAHCSAENMRGKAVKFQVWYYYSDDVTPVNDSSGSHLWHETEDTVLYDQAEWKDVSFFIPYSDINVPSGFHDNLAVDFVIRDEDFEVLDRKDNNAFNFRK